MRLTPPRLLNLETALSCVRDDELIEVTPDHIRIRKRVLEENERRKQRKKGVASEIGDISELELLPSQ